MAVTGTKTVRDIVTAALRKAGLVDWSQEPEADESAVALAELNSMLKAWQADGWALWLAAEQTVTPVASQVSYTLSPARPLRILSAWWRTSGGIDIPMQRLTRREYNELPDKDSTGVPTCYYYDRQRETATLKVWPAPSSVTTETIRVDYEREQEDIASLNDTLDLPGEWWEAAVYSLADRMLDTWQRPNPTITAKAAMAVMKARGADREESVYFAGEPW